MTEEQPLFLGSWKGRVIKAITVDGARTWEDLREMTGLFPKTLNKVLQELFVTNAIYKKDDGTYRVDKQLFMDYTDYFKEYHQKEVLPKVKISKNVQQELPKWIDDWKGVKRLDHIDLKNKHFYLEGRFLDDFSKEIISHAKGEIIVVNPWIRDCDLSDTLREAAEEEVSVTLVIRSTDDNHEITYHEVLKRSGVQIYTNNKVHAKLIVVDRAVAIASSMNFIVQSSGGQSWEAGIVTIDP